MSQKGFRYDMNKCLECRACVVSCKDKNDLPVGVNFNEIQERERGKFPEVFVWFTLKMCRHCSNPACVEKCPTGAMTKDEETGIAIETEGRSLKNEPDYVFYVKIGVSITTNGRFLQIGLYNALWG